MTKVERGLVERLAHTGEGVVRLNGKTVFVEGALPGEEVDYEIFEERSRFCRARVQEVRRASPDRRPTDEHSRRCGGADWAHLDPAAARAAKREIFRETLERVGRVPRETLGELPMDESPLEYRLRNQLHLQRSDGRLCWGFFEKRSRRVVPLDGCEIVSAPTRKAFVELGPRLGRELREGETRKVEVLETVETDGSHRLAHEEGARLEIRLPRAAFLVSVGSFFQVNRFRVSALYDLVLRRAAELGGETALDACAGVGLLSHALLSAGYRVTAVEAEPRACRDAEENRRRWGATARLSLVQAKLEDFAAFAPGAFDLVVADPPREGLGDSASRLAALARRALIYVSCEPATLARDLRTLSDVGFRIELASLEDFFPLTHRMEACVVLSRRRAE